MIAPPTSHARIAAAALCLSLWPSLASAQTYCMVAELDGQQETPPNASAARGTGFFLVDTAAQRMTYWVSFDNLSGAQTGAFIHGFAPPGVFGATRITLPMGNTISGVWDYPANKEQDILNGLTYINVHSTTVVGGEIRGQIVRDVSNASLLVQLTDAQAVPPSVSGNTGTGYFSIDTTANTVTYQITRSLALNETAAHIHGLAPAGSTAGAKHTLPAGFHKRGVWSYSEADEAGILAGLTYVNLHSTINPSGEIRGQALSMCDCEPGISNYCTAGMTSSGCSASINAAGIPSATLGSGFVLSASGVEGNKTGLFFFGSNGQQANTWGNGTSFQCVIPPAQRAGVLAASGSIGACDGAFAQDLNARWCPTCPQFGHNPGAGAVVQAQLWFRDPGNTSNQTSSLSDAVEFTLCP